MKSINKAAVLIAITMLISGCHITSQQGSYILEIETTPYRESDSSWARATEIILRHHQLYYSQQDLLDYQYVYLDTESTPTIDDISWLLWDLGGLDSYVSGTLSLIKIRSQLRQGSPVMLQYGPYYSGHYLVIYGYDDHDRVYIHEPGYGTRVIHYTDLYYQRFHGKGHYWESSLLIEP